METRKGNGEAKAVLVPPVDIIENPEGITLRADLPGVARENLAIDVDNDTLTIEGDVALGEPANLQGVYAEVRVAHYKRSFVLSRDLDASRIEASMKNGVLTLVVPKAEQAKPRRIAVRAD
ncbi:MAG: Hsp20/alpha crystallin family protein [Bacillota bacterium]